MRRNNLRDPVNLDRKVSIVWDGVFQQSEADEVPIIGSLAAEILIDILLLKRPAKILEIGTGMGYSTFILHTYKHPHGIIHTIDSNQHRLSFAVESFEKAGIFHDIIPWFGDACEVLSKLKENSFDFIFIDAQKSSYRKYLDLVEPLLCKDGIIVSDDVLFRADKGYDYHPKIHKNTVNNLERFRKMIIESPWESIIFPIEDGISLTWKAGCKS